MSERSSHPSSAQIEALLDFLERNPDLAKGYSKCQQAREKSRRQWEELSLTLNSLGGTIKTPKQWTKYWSDKKSAVKKKVAARAAARRKTGGGLDGVVELSEVEERIVALLGGEGFGTGDSHLAIPVFSENVTSDRLPHTLPSDSEEIIEHLSVSGQTRQVNRKLFDSSEDIFNTEQSQSILLNIHQQRDFSPPPATLSQTPSPILPIPSTSRRGATVRDAGSSTSRQAQPPTPRLAPESEASPSRRDATRTNTRMVPASGDASSSSMRSAQHPPPRLPATPASEASPSRRGATTGSNASRNIRNRRNATSTTRTTRATAAAPAPPSQRQSEFSRITERFLRVEEQQLEIQQSNARILQAVLDQTIERDRVLSQAVAAMGEGLQALAEAIRQTNSNSHN